MTINRGRVVPLEALIARAPICVCRYAAVRLNRALLEAIAYAALARIVGMALTSSARSACQVS